MYVDGGILITGWKWMYMIHICGRCCVDTSILISGWQCTYVDTVVLTSAWKCSKVNATLSDSSVRQFLQSKATLDSQAVVWCSTSSRDGLQVAPFSPSLSDVRAHLGVEHDAEDCCSPPSEHSHLYDPQDRTGIKRDQEIEVASHPDTVDENEGE